MAAPLNPSSAVEILLRLSPRLYRRNEDYTYFDRYYEGTQRLDALGMALPPELQELRTVINIPRIGVDALEERLDLENFRVDGKTESSNRFLDWWRANELDAESGPSHVEALVQGNSYVSVSWTPGDDHPLIVPEPALGMVVETDPRTRQLTAAVRRWRTPIEEGEQRELATVYLPDETWYLELDKSDMKWKDYDYRRHNAGVVPVVPLTNRRRVGDIEGRSELTDLIPITDAACRIMTNLQGAQELMAVPARYVLGVKKEDFQDSNGQPIPAWEAYMGRMNALTGDNAKVVQLTPADLRNFTDTLSHYYRTAAAVSGVPAHYFAFTSENPTSADAIRSSEARLVKKAERKAQSFGSSWEKVMKVGLRMMGEDPTNTKLEAVWRDPATPTYAAKAAALKDLWQSGIPLPPSYAFDVLGLTPDQRSEAEKHAETTVDPLRSLLDQMGASGAGNGPQNGTGSQEPQPGNGGSGSAVPNAPRS